MTYRDDRPSDVLWEDGERLYRRIWRDMGDGARREFLVAQPCAEHPTQAVVNRLAHEHGLKDYLDSEWALRPLELVRERSQTMLVLYVLERDATRSLERTRLLDDSRIVFVASEDGDL